MLNSVLLFTVLFESNANIVALGFPEIIASLISQKFGKHAFTVAKWLKQHSSYRSMPGEDGALPENWWRKTNSNFISRELDLATLVEIYEAAKTSEEKYREVMSANGFKPTDIFNQEEVLKFIKREIANKMFEETFFKYDTLIADIASGKLIDLKPYKDLSYQAAKDKYDKKRIFKDPGKVIKQYANGWRWIDAGPKCQLVGGLMKNCGSTGVMSLDKDSTMMTLFDPKNKPHVVTTYSPNEKRLSGAEGIGSSEPKEKYDEFIIDLAIVLGVNFDWDKSKSKSLKLKWVLRNQFKEIKLIGKSSVFSEYYQITMNDDSVYYTDSYSFVHFSEIESVANSEFAGDKLKAIQKAFNHYQNRDIKNIDLYDFINGKR